MENYICINGKKAELTEEQMKALGIELPKASPFTIEKDETYWFITSYGALVETNTNANRKDRHNAGNYCTDHDMMKHRALHETLNRLLWRYSMEHDGDKIDKDFFMVIKEKGGLLNSYSTSAAGIGEVKFYSHEDAKAAIEEVIEPFMKAHPDFKW